MNFELTKEQQMVREMVKDFAKKEIAPHAEYVDQTGEFPIQTFQKMGDLGLMGIPFLRNMEDQAEIRFPMP